MRILFTSLALSGHFFPLVPLAWACRSIGHEVLVATSDNFVHEVLHSGLPVAPIGPATDFVESGAGEAVADHPDLRRYSHGRAFGRMAVSGHPGMMSLVRSWQPELVVSERAEFAGPIAAAAYRVPTVELHWGIGPLEEYRLAANAELRPQLAGLGLSSLPTPTHAVNPWPPSLRLPYSDGHRSIRYVPYNGAAQVPHWALGQRNRPRICITFGTVLPRLAGEETAEVFVPILQDLARLDIELVVAVDDKVAAAWPPLPDAVRHVGRVPLSQVLSACDAAIHHGGQGTALTALGAATPQLVIPAFDDQLDNADAVVRSGAGLRLRTDEITPQAITERCVELLRAPRYRRAAEDIAAEIAAQPTPAEVAGSMADFAASGVKC